jgi:ankyrin repeat protein
MSCFSIPGQVDERNDGGSTPLALAAADGHLSLLARMVGLGADINAANQYGMRPLHRCPLPRFRACAARPKRSGRAWGKHAIPHARPGG